MKWVLAELRWRGVGRRGGRRPAWPHTARSRAGPWRRESRRADRISVVDRAIIRAGRRHAKAPPAPRSRRRAAVCRVRATMRRWRRPPKEDHTCRGRVGAAGAAAGGVLSPRGVESCCGGAREGRAERREQEHGDSADTGEAQTRAAAGGASRAGRLPRARRLALGPRQRRWTRSSACWSTQRRRRRRKWLREVSARHGGGRSSEFYDTNCNARQIEGIDLQSRASLGLRQTLTFGCLRCGRITIVPRGA